MHLSLSRYLATPHGDAVVLAMPSVQAHPMRHGAEAAAEATFLGVLPPRSPGEAAGVARDGRQQEAAARAGVALDVAVILPPPCTFH